jgi:hypothetical protein
VGTTVGTGTESLGSDVGDSTDGQRAAELAAAHASRVGTRRQERVEWTRSRRSLVRRALIAADLAALTIALVVA